MSALPLPEGFDGLSVEEKIEYVQELWDLIATESDAAELPDHQRQTLRERLARHRETPDEGECWEALRDRLRRSS